MTNTAAFAPTTVDYAPGTDVGPRLFETDALIFARARDSKRRIWDAEDHEGTRYSVSEVHHYSVRYGYNQLTGVEFFAYVVLPGAGTGRRSQIGSFLSLAEACHALDALARS